MGDLVNMTGPRTYEPGLKVYRCVKCGHVDNWREAWNDIDQGRDVPCYCPECAPAATDEKFITRT